MRRILFVSHVGELGGAEHSLVTLVSCLDQGRYDAHVALSTIDSPLGRALLERGAETHAIPSLRPLRRRDPFMPITLIRGQRALSALARRLRPDVIHANSDVSMAYAAGLYTESGSGRAPWRIVWHLRDMRGAGYWVRHLRDHSHARIAVSRAVLDHHGLHACERSRVIYNGVDLSRFRPGVSGASIRRELAIGADRVLCLCVAQAVPWKNLDTFAGLSGEGYERLLIAYPPPGGRPMACPASGPGLQVVGYRDDMPEVYAAADVLVHPAIGEAFGRTVVEAMACGVPVVAYRHGGPAETIVHGVSGLLVDPKEPEALECAVDRLVADADLRGPLAVGAAERARAFSSESHATQVEAFYEDLIEGGAG